MGRHRSGKACVAIGVSCDGWELTDRHAHIDISKRRRCGASSINGISDDASISLAKSRNGKDGCSASNKILNIVLRAGRSGYFDNSKIFIQFDVLLMYDSIIEL